MTCTGVEGSKRRFQKFIRFLARWLVDVSVAGLTAMRSESVPFLFFFYHASLSVFAARGGRLVFFLHSW